MKALVLKNYSHFEIQEVPTPELRDDEVLIAVHACGICGSDVHGMDGSTGRRKPPIIMGHEASGLIAKCGRHTSSLREGMRVTFDSTVYCGKCRFCRRGHINLCDNRQVLGVSCDEYRREGAFAEFVAVPAHIVYPLPDEVSFVEAAMIEPLSVALHAVVRSTIRLGETALVVGTGMIGLLLVQVLRVAGATCVFAVDIEDMRLQLARKLGADYCLQAGTQNITDIIRNATDGVGVDHAFEAVGHSEALEIALGSLRKGGTLTLVGNISPSVVLPLQATVTKEISVYGSCASAGEYLTCLDMIAKKRVQVSPLISAVAPLEQGPDWFERLHRREKGLMKVILTPVEQ